MRTEFECLPCLVRQALTAVRAAGVEVGLVERALRECLRVLADADLALSPPLLSRELHRRVREVTGVEDPYREAKERFDRLVLGLLPEWVVALGRSPDPLALATRLAIAGNVIDLGVGDDLTEVQVREALASVLTDPFDGDLEGFRSEVQQAREILYLADNAGEIALDRLLVAQLPVGRVTVAVRGAPVLNDATLADARAVGIDELAEVIDNGSDVPGTALADCSPEFRRRFERADLILAKGQGNFETLGGEPRPIWFLFKVKCALVAEHVGLPTGTQVLLRAGRPTAIGPR